jgi:spore coat polysaccharide biosynthesis protein SpsF (cytidylyltransferase family)
VIVIGIQARSGSTRFPGKIYEKIGDKSVLEMIYDTCLEVNPAPNFIGSPSVYVLGHEGDDKLQTFCKEKGMDLTLHVEENDVLSRYTNPEFIREGMCMVRITSDCPLVRVKDIEAVIMGLAKHDYVSNVYGRTFLDGFDVQGCTSKFLQWHHENNMGREHPFLGMDCESELKIKASEIFKINYIMNSDRQIFNAYHPENKLSLDTPEDLERIRKYHERITQQTK